MIVDFITDLESFVQNQVLFSTLYSVGFMEEQSLEEILAEVICHTH